MADSKTYLLETLVPGVEIVAGSFLTTDGYTSTGTGWTSIAGDGLGKYTITHDNYPGVIACGAWIEEDTADDTARVRIHSTDPTNGKTYLMTQTSAGTDADLNAQTIHFILLFRNTNITS